MHVDAVGVPQGKGVFGGFAYFGIAHLPGFVELLVNQSHRFRCVPDGVAKIVAVNGFNHLAQLIGALFCEAKLGLHKVIGVAELVGGVEGGNANAHHAGDQCPHPSHHRTSGQAAQLAGEPANKAAGLLLGVLEDLP